MTDAEAIAWIAEHKALVEFSDHIVRVTAQMKPKPAPATTETRRLGEYPYLTNLDALLAAIRAVSVVRP